jgi:hypothetical protein
VKLAVATPMALMETFGRDSSKREPIGDNGILEKAGD